MSQDNPQLTPDQVRVVTKVRRLMMIASATTFIALAAVMAVIGYRVFHGKESGMKESGMYESAPDVTARIPKGARIISTATAGDRIIVTLEIGTAIEIQTFDVQTLRSTGRLKFMTEP
jgi:hypothetical protein